MLKEEAIGADGPEAWSSREKRRRVNGQPVAPAKDPSREYRRRVSSRRTFGWMGCQHSDAAIS